MDMTALLPLKEFREVLSFVADVMAILGVTGVFALGFMRRSDKAHTRTIMQWLGYFFRVALCAGVTVFIVPIILLLIAAFDRIFEWVFRVCAPVIPSLVTPYLSATPLLAGIVAGLIVFPFYAAACASILDASAKPLKFLWSSLWRRNP